LTAEVDDVHRAKVTLHHSATHLLHAALKKVLGDEVAQAGSYVSAESARFDFSFNRALSLDELTQIEGLVNQWIQSDEPTGIVHASLEERPKHRGR
jgi:alanyl-tRNA synthetase